MIFTKKLQKRSEIEYLIKVMSEAVAKLGLSPLSINKRWKQFRKQK